MRARRLAYPNPVWEGFVRDPRFEGCFEEEGWGWDVLGRGRVGLRWRRGGKDVDEVKEG